MSKSQFKAYEDGIRFAKNAKPKSEIEIIDERLAWHLKTMNNWKKIKKMRQ